MTNHIDTSKDEPVPARRSSRLWVFITLVVTVVLLFLALRGVVWSDILATMKRARIDYLLLSCLTFTTVNVLRSLRWRILLQAENHVAAMTSFWATMVGYLGNNVLPARAGEVLRSVLLGNATGMSKSYVFATALTERIMDVPALVLIGLLSLSSLSSVPSWVLTTIHVMTWIGVVGVVILLILPRIEHVVLTFVALFPLPGRLQARLHSFIEQFLFGMRALQRPDRAFGFLTLTIIVWLVDASTAMIIARSLDLSLSLPQACLLLTALGLASAAPSTPGYVGIYQFVSVTILVPFGFSRNEAIVYILAFQLITYIVVLTGGGIGLWKLGNPRALFQRSTAFE